MTSIKINSQTYPAEIYGTMRDTNWNNRESKSIKIEMNYNDAISLFVDNIKWSIIYQASSYIDPETEEEIIPEPEEYDNSEYCLAGDITDHRNGYITVKMGKLTSDDMLKILEEALKQ